MLFRRIVFYALLVGAISGLALTAVQYWQVVPIIMSAETFEGGGEAAAPVAAHGEQGHSHAGHEHDGEAWGPQEGFERTFFTLLSNVLTAVGLALVLLAAMATAVRSNASTKLSWQHGLLWGAAGYAVFFLAPSLGLPPEIPGAVAAPLQARQFWWLFAVLCTAGGLAGVAFGKSPWRWAALGLIVVPHLVGAPHHSGPMFPDQPPEAVAELTRLTREFFTATAIANAVLWLALGLSAAWAARRILTEPNNPQT